MTANRERGAQSRKQVSYQGKPERGLFERSTSDGGRVYEMCVKRSGKVIRRKLAAQTATDAVREMRALVAKIDAGTHLVSRTDLSLQELRDTWAEWATGPTTTLTPRVVELYLQRLDQHVIPQLNRYTRATAVTPAQLRKLIDRLTASGLSGGSVCGCVSAVSAIFRFGVRNGLLESNPVRGLELGDRPSGKRNRQPRYLDRQEIDALLAKLPDEHRPVAACMAFAGLRVSEVLGLTWAMVDLDSGMLDLSTTGTKTAGSAAPVPMTGDLVAELRAHRRRQSSIERLQPEALLFPTNRKVMLRAINAAGDAAGLNADGGVKVGNHDLRHSCASLLLSANVPPARVAAILRHSNPRTTLSIYAGVTTAERASLVSDLERALVASE